MKKIFSLLVVLLLFAGAVRAYDKTEINLVCDVTLPPGTEGLKATLVSYVNDDELNIRHENPNYYIERAKQNPLTRECDSTTVVITGENDEIVFKKEYNTTRVPLQLNYLGILSGKYKLNICWRNHWWRGDFDFKSHWPEGLAAYIDSTYYLLNKGYATVTEPDYYLPNRRTRSHRMYWNCFERDYPLHVVIPSELTYEGETYQVTRVDGGAFQHCHFLLSIKLPNTITYIGDCAFANCDNLRQFKIPESVTETGFAVFGGCSSLSDIVIPEGITTLRNQMFNGCTNLSAVTLPSSLTTIEFFAFAGCTSLPYIVIPDDVTSIEERAFQNCGLTEIILSAKLKLIGEYAFYNCKALASIVIPERVRSIGAEAFAGCTGLASVTIPESVTTIGDKAFADMPRSGHIYCNAKEPFTIGANTFNYACTLHVPYGCKEAYLKAENWKNFTNIEEMEEEKFDEPVYYGDMTGVAPAVNDDAAADGQYYDLQGRPVSGTQRGIYILGGKKVLVR